MDMAGLEVASMQVVASAGLVKPVSEMWLAATHKPSAAEVKKQLQALRRRQTPSTKEEAEKKMRGALAKVSQAGQRWQDNPTLPLPEQTHDYQAMVEDGQGSPEWRASLQQGNLVPQPFLTGGFVGANPLFSLSAVREFLALRKLGGWLAAPTTSSETSGGNVSRVGWVPRTTAALQKEVVMFVDALCPEGADRDDPPDWVGRLLDGDLLEAKCFWR